MNDIEDPGRTCLTCAFRLRSRDDYPCCECYGFVKDGVYHPRYRPGSSVVAHLAGLTMARRP